MYEIEESHIFANWPALPRIQSVSVVACGPRKPHLLLLPRLAHRGTITSAPGGVWYIAGGIYGIWPLGRMLVRAAHPTRPGQCFTALVPTSAWCSSASSAIPLRQLWPQVTHTLGMHRHSDRASPVSQNDKLAHKNSISRPLQQSHPIPMAKFGLRGFLREQLQTVPPVATADLTGKTVVVIGANTGLGFEATKHFARMNPARLILACRNITKGEAAIERLRNETGYQSAELWIIDLSVFSSVVAFADKFEQDGGRLDILVENAGCIRHTYEATADGWETTLQVNCLSLSLPALRLLPHMIKTGEKHKTRPRLVVVTSEVHSWSNIEKRVLDGDEIYKTLASEEYCTPTIMAGRYNDSKLLNVFFYQALNERLPRSPLIVNGVNPGYCYSELRRSLPPIYAAVDRVMEKVLARTTEEGARQLIYAAVGGADDEDKLCGAYISTARVAEASDFAISAEGKIVQDKLWNEMARTLAKIDPRVRGVADTYLTAPVSELFTDLLHAYSNFGLKSTHHIHRVCSTTLRCKFKRKAGKRGSQ